MQSDAFDDDEGDAPREPRYWRVSGFGILVAALFFAASLTPSLMPRPALMQGALSGVSAALGYALGAFLLWLWYVMRLPGLAGAAERLARTAQIVLGLIVCGVALSYAAEWQNATRRIMALDPLDTADPVLIGGAALGVFAIFWLLGSAFMFLTRRTGRALSRVLPGRTGPLLGLLITVYLFWALGDGVLVRRVMQAADASFAAGELVIGPEQVAPTDPTMAGGPGSLVTWEDLGNRGRDFITRTPSAEEIAAFYGDGAERPVRVYVGRVSAEGARARAELALQELIRQGGFDKELLIVTTPVGTGWMDPGSHDAVDFIWGGRTAHVGAQYSYLTSVLSILTNVEYGLDQARALFEVIYQHWLTLPADSRPKFYIHGLSQGALNSQATLPFYNLIAEPIDGAFWAGSPFVSRVWERVRNNREPGSPVWRPKFGNGSLVRVTNQDNVLDDAGFTPWGPMRLVFLHYGSDPIVNFDVATFWRAPAWLRHERPPDIPEEMQWYPFVTAFQVMLDMTTALGVEGFGHFYVADDYIDAWAALTDPPGWSGARADELRRLFRDRPAPW
ncbi:MAG: alpha/beta-hydrolase family protein [Pseudomonadota bacterium]